MTRCLICGQDEELNIDVCWDCWEAELVMRTGQERQGKKIPTMDGRTDEMAKLKWIIENHTGLCETIQKENHDSRPGDINMFWGFDSFIVYN